jgi:hypothetical protein
MDDSSDSVEEVKIPVDSKDKVAKGKPAKDKTAKEKPASTKKQKKANGNGNKHFRKEEIQYLVKLVAARKNVLESKITSRSIHDIAAKANCWNSLATAFNSGCKFTSGRTVTQLRKKWENIKSDAKKAAGERKKEQFKTGGGQVKLEEVDEILLMAEDIISGAMEPMPSSYDSDSKTTLIKELGTLEAPGSSFEGTEISESLEPAPHDSEDVKTPTTNKMDTPDSDEYEEKIPEKSVTAVYQLKI